MTVTLTAAHRFLAITAIALFFGLFLSVAIGIHIPRDPLLTAIVSIATISASSIVLVFLFLHRNQTFCLIGWPLVLYGLTSCVLGFLVMVVINDFITPISSRYRGLVIHGAIAITFTIPWLVHEVRRTRESPVWFDCLVAPYLFPFAYVLIDSREADSWIFYLGSIKYWIFIAAPVALLTRVVMTRGRQIPLFGFFVVVATIALMTLVWYCLFGLMEI